jgi:hypothetical protein
VFTGARQLHGFWYHFVMWWFFCSSRRPRAGEPLFFDCARLLIQCICDYTPYLLALWRLKMAWWRRARFNMAKILIQFIFSSNSQKMPFIWNSKGSEIPCISRVVTNQTQLLATFNVSLKKSAPLSNCIRSLLIINNSLFVNRNLSNKARGPHCLRKHKLNAE